METKHKKNKNIIKLRLYILKTDLMIFLNNYNSQGGIISDTLIKKETEILKENYNIDYFKISPGWISNFKKRNGLKKQKIYGWFKEYKKEKFNKLKNILKIYKHDNIFILLLILFKYYWIIIYFKILYYC